MSERSIGLVNKWNYTSVGDYEKENKGWLLIHSKNLLLDYNPCSKENYNKIINSKEFKEMPVYPDKGAIKMIDDILVVKLTDKPYKN